MNTIVLVCTLDRCNVDGTKKMSLNKCVVKSGTPCYYLREKEMDNTPDDLAWNKFDSFVKSKSNPQK